MQKRLEQHVFVFIHLCLRCVSACVCLCVCRADDFPVIIFNAEQRKHEHWLASVAKHCVAGNSTKL